MAEEPKGCARTIRAVVGEKPTVAPLTNTTQSRNEATITARVGPKAPAYYQGKFTNASIFDDFGK